MTAQTPVVSEVQPADLGVVRAMLGEYAAWIGVSLEFQQFALELANPLVVYGAADAGLLIARVGQDAEGMVAFRRLDHDRCEMKRLYVRRHARGRGIGRLLVERGIAHARRLGYREMVLDTLPMMHAAQQMYVTLGFRDIAPYYASPIPGTRYMALTL